MQARSRRLPDLLADPGDVPRHDGPAARRGAVLHQPRRPGRATYDAVGARDAQCVLPAPHRCTAFSAALYASDLISTGRADSVVLALPGRIFGGIAGDLLTALLGAGAFAAFLSTSSGLVMSVGGVVGQDLLGRRFGGVAAFRIAAPRPRWSRCCALSHVGAGGRARGRAGLRGGGLDLLSAAPAGHLVARAHRSRGAVAGLLVGGAHVGLRGRHGDGRRVARRLAGRGVAQPALCTVPLAFATMVGVSLADAGPAAGAPRPDDGAAAHPRGDRARPGQLPPRGKQALTTPRRWSPRIDRSSWCDRRTHRRLRRVRRPRRRRSCPGGSPAS